MYDLRSFEPFQAFLFLFAAFVCFLLSRWRTNTLSSAPCDTASDTYFVYPKFDACLDDLAQTRPIPYRPFRWGDYHVTMGIRPMDWACWIELDQEHIRYFQIKDHRINSRRAKLIKTLDAQPGIVGSGHAAAKELVYELAEYLSRRYPTTYTVTRYPTGEHVEGGWYGQGRIHTISITPMKRTFDLDIEDPLEVSALLVQDDLAIMIEGTDGRYYLQAGAIVIPGVWRLEDKAGMPLDEIHNSGGVPHYREKLQLSLGRFFKRMPVDKPVVRYNYTFQLVNPLSADSSKEKQIDPDEISWSTTMFGDEDNGIATREHAGAKPETIPTPSMMRLRTERQTFRRLPQTGAIVFTIRTYVTPVEEFVKEPGVPARLASSVRSWPEIVARYKHRELFEPALLEYLDEWHKRQIEQNIDVVEANYPW